MGKLLLVLRLAMKDLRRNPAEAALLLMAIASAAATLSIALALRGVTDHPYATTRAATEGPDVIAAVQTNSSAALAGLTALKHAPGVTRSSGPYVLDFPTLVVNGHQDPVLVEGRDTTPATVDQPKVTAGTWVRNGGVVVERSLADLLDLKVGERITLGTSQGGYAPGQKVVGPTFEIVGIAVSAAVQPPAISTYAHPSGFPQPGLIWATRAASERLALAMGGPFGYTLNLDLASAPSAPSFVAAHQSGELSLISWQTMATKNGDIISIEQTILLTGSSLLALLALASVALLVGGRMEQQTRRVGLLKAVGASPGIVTGILLTEQLLLSVVAATLGLVIGRFAAPFLTNPGASLLGTPGAPSLDLSAIFLVFAAAIAVAVIATFVPAVRAARTSTVVALADSPRPPRRARLSITISSRLPVPLLLGVRLASRRRRRAALSAASVAVTVGALVAVLLFREHANALESESAGGLYRFSGPGDPLWERGMDVMLVFTIALVTLALVNAILATWATVQDTRRSAAIERALGASPEQSGSAMIVAQLISSIPGAVVGVPLGVALYSAVGRHSSTSLSVVGLVGVVVAALFTVALLAAIPASASARRPVAEALQSETI